MFSEATASRAVTARPGLGPVSESRVDQGAGIPRPAGKAEEEPIAELWATTTTPPAGMRGPASRAGTLRQALAGPAASADSGASAGAADPARVAGPVSGAVVRHVEARIRRLDPG